MCAFDFHAQNDDRCANISKTGTGSRTTLGLPVLFDCRCACVVCTAHESKIGSCPVHMCIIENLSGFFSFKFSQGTCHWMASALKLFFGFCNFFSSVGQIVCRDYVAFWGWSNISFVWPVHRNDFLPISLYLQNTYHC